MGACSVLRCPLLLLYPMVHMQPPRCPMRIRSGPLPQLLLTSARLLQPVPAIPLHITPTYSPPCHPIPSHVDEILPFTTPTIPPFTPPAILLFPTVPHH